MDPLQFSVFAAAQQLDKPLQATACLSQKLSARQAARLLTCRARCGELTQQDKEVALQAVRASEKRLVEVFWHCLRRQEGTALQAYEKMLREEGWTQEEKQATAEAMLDTLRLHLEQQPANFSLAVETLFWHSQDTMKQLLASSTVFADLCQRAAVDGLLVEAQHLVQTGTAVLLVNTRDKTYGISIELNAQQSLQMQHTSAPVQLVSNADAQGLCGSPMRQPEAGVELPRLDETQVHEKAHKYALLRALKVPFAAIERQQKARNLVRNTLEAVLDKQQQRQLQLGVEKPTAPASGGGKVLFVGVPADWTNEDVECAFAPYGAEVNKAEVMRSRNGRSDRYALVPFQHSADATRAEHDAERVIRNHCRIKAQETGRQHKRPAESSTN